MCVHLQLLSELGLSTTHDMDLSHVPKLTGKFSPVRNFSFTMAMTLLTALLGIKKLEDNTELEMWEAANPNRLVRKIQTEFLIIIFATFQDQKKSQWRDD